MPSHIETIPVAGCDNRSFLQKHAAPGRIGLSTGVTLVDRLIARAQRHLDPRERWGTWSHAFLFQGERPDGRHWLIESDLQVHRKHIQLGVQENRVDKYHDEKLYTSLAVLDFGLPPAQAAQVIRAALDLVADRTCYSLRELVGTLFALRHPELRTKENQLAQERSLFCSAFIRHIYRAAGVDLLPGVNPKLTTPEDIAGSPVPHRLFLLKRQVPGDKRLISGHRLQAKLRLLRKRTRRLGQ
jgi:hypothetical protein